MTLELNDIPLLKIKHNVRGPAAKRYLFRLVEQLMRRGKGTANFFVRNSAAFANDYEAARREYLEHRSAAAAASPPDQRQSSGHRGRSRVAAINRASSSSGAMSS